MSQLKNNKNDSTKKDKIVKDAQDIIDTATVLSKLKFDGSIGFNQSVDLNAIIQINEFVIIPIHIAGTVSKPSPDLFNFITFIEANFLKPVGEGVLNVLKTPETMAEKLFDNADTVLERIIP